jgi:hypothetical protein
MRNNTLSQPKAIAMAILGALFGIWVLYSQIQQDSRHRELKSVGQSTVGILREATHDRVNFIPIGYSFQTSYLGQSKEFDVSKNSSTPMSMPRRNSGSMKKLTSYSCPIIQMLLSYQKCSTSGHGEPEGH